jgi:Icc-related predicted phosphoesterase
MRIYYTSDLHGSETCWRKFLAASQYYQADVIMIGGDITGKFIVPIIHLPKGRAEATFLGRKRKLKRAKDVDRLREQIAHTGQYAVDVTPEEFEAYAQDPARMNALFQKLLLERVKHWVEMADERLQDQQVRCFVAAGNDDLFEVDDVLAQSERIEMHDGHIIDLGEGFEMFGCGYCNMTPWNCPRDVSEEVLAEKIEALASQIKNPKRAIFDLHAPPYDTDIDKAPQLTEDMRLVLDGSGAPKMVPVGSTAVREVILKYQPMISLHGHIHESAGIRMLGETTIVNPGSEYAEGILRGVLIEIDSQEGLVSVDLVTG